MTKQWPDLDGKAGVGQSRSLALCSSLSTWNNGFQATCEAAWWTSSRPQTNLEAGGTGGRCSVELLKRLRLCDGIEVETGLPVTIHTHQSQSFKKCWWAEGYKQKWNSLKQEVPCLAAVCGNNYLLFRWGNFYLLQQSQSVSLVTCSALSNLSHLHVLRQDSFPFQMSFSLPLAGYVRCIKYLLRFSGIMVLNLLRLCLTPSSNKQTFGHRVARNAGRKSQLSSSSRWQTCPLQRLTGRLSALDRRELLSKEESSVLTGSSWPASS